MLGIARRLNDQRDRLNQPSDEKEEPRLRPILAQMLAQGAYRAGCTYYIAIIEKAGRPSGQTLATWLQRTWGAQNADL